MLAIVKTQMVINDDAGAKSQRSNWTPSGFGTAVTVDGNGDARTFYEHGRRADDATLADVLGRAGNARLRNAWQQFEVASQTFCRRVRRLPMRERLPAARPQIDRGDETVAGSGVEAGEEAFRPPENSDGELSAVGADIGVVADDGRAETGGSIGQTL